MAQDDYFYEIQLTNKQLVFYFMAGATGLILSFLAGVMVGRGVDSAVAEAQPAKPPSREERIVAEETPRPAAPASAEELNYAKRLESDKPDDTLEKAATPKSTVEKAAEKSAEKNASSGRPDKPGKTAKAEAASKAKDKGDAKETAAAAAKEPAPVKPAPNPEVASKEPPKPTKDAAAVKDAPAPRGSFTIQVGAFKEKSAADSVASRLKGKGFAAYVVSPEGAEGGLFNVRVGSYSSKADAERTETRLRDEEKFKPFIVKP